MVISIIGTNGLLSSSILTFCHLNLIEVHLYGRTVPKLNHYASFTHVDLLNLQINFDNLSKSDVIIYAAGAGIQSNRVEDVNTVYNLNVFIPIQICNSLKHSNFKGTFVSFGSYFEIGENNENKEFDELEVLRSQLKAPNDYTITKRMLSRFFSSFNAPFNFIHFILPTIYGETESPHRLIPYTLASIKNVTKITFTSGEQVRQYVYIDDVVNTLFHSVKGNLESGIYNICGAEEFSVKELVSLLFQLNQKVLPDDVFGKTERVDVGMKVLRLNGEKLKSKIGYLQTIKISEVFNKYNFQ